MNVNVPPHSGVQANAAAYHALLRPGDRAMGLQFDHRGHLMHGMRLNVSGKLYEMSLGVDRETGLIDMDQVAARAGCVRS